MRWDVTLFLRGGGAYTYDGVHASCKQEAVGIAMMWFERDEPGQEVARARAVQHDA